MEAHNHSCLNCGAETIGAYCHGCGQKAATHRITIPHLVKHDLVHGVWHFDKGLLFTAREAFLRPGHMAMDYIKGKRVKYYNVFYLILLVLGLNLLTALFLKDYYGGHEKTHTGLLLEENSVDVSYYVRNYFKLIVFFVMPFFALFGMFSFRRLKLNFAEHTIIAGSLLLTGAMWYLFVVVGMYSSNRYGSDIFNAIVWGFAFIVCLQPARVYYQAAGKLYTKGGITLRILLWYALLTILFYAVMLTVVYVTGKETIKLR